MDAKSTLLESDYLPRKVDAALLSWKRRDHLPLLVKGARQVGKTESILRFGRSNYRSVVYVNFVLQPAYRSIVGEGYEVENVVRQMTLVDAGLKFIPGATLVVFDEVQAAPDVMTTLKSFKIDGRYDVIASGSLLGVHYRQVTSFATGYEEEMEMHSMDFEEFLLARGRDSRFVDSLFQHMLSSRPLGELERKVWDELFLEFCVVGGMPAAVRTFVTQGNYQGVAKIQRDILKLYRQDARRYCEGLDSARILDVYDSVPAQLAKEYKKFQYSGVRKGASARDYAGCLRWLEDAGLIVRAFCMHQPELPIKGNVDSGVFKVYYPDTGLLLATLDDEAALDFKVNRNFHTYKGGIAENIAAEAIAKAGKPLSYFKRENSTLELDFLLRTADALVPVEVKSSNNNAKSLKTAIASSAYPDIRFGIKLVAGNIGHENAIYTFPRFCAFLLSRFLAEAKNFTLMLLICLLFAAEVLSAGVLSGGWTADGNSVEIPHTWNAVDAADGATKRYGHAGESIRSDSYLRKRVVYRRALPDGDGKKAFVRINGASQTAVVSVNGRKLFTHRGAFTPFVVEVTEAMRPTGNVLEIAVDNFVNPDIPPVHADFSLFGGLYRTVEFFRESVPAFPPAKPWPFPEKIRGINRHQDFAGKGWAISPEDEARDVALMKEMGVNLVRTAHYPTSENFYSLCDKAGIAVISEASAVDYVTESAAFRTNYLAEIREMVEAFRHHPCIVAWGLFNEMASDEKVAAPIVAEGAKLLRALDPSRPVYGVADIWNVGKRAMQANVDWLGFNVYPGWYAGNPTDIVENVNRCFAQSGRATGFIAEYGAGGSPNHHDLSGKRPGASYVRFHPEEYQALVHEIEYRAISSDPRLRGGVIWCFADFASDVRDEGEKPGINDKGVVTYDRSVKKDVYYFYQANWTDTPVLHIVGSRAGAIACETADLRVYSNVGDVTLTVNGACVGTRSPDEVKVAIFKDVRFRPGKNEIVARAKDREIRWTSIFIN